MRRKADRLAGGKLKDCKARGEWTELYFMMMTAGQAMKVSKPFGESGKYDVGVENQIRVLRVQVKSIAYMEREDEYSLNLMGTDSGAAEVPARDRGFFRDPAYPCRCLVHHPGRSSQCNPQSSL
jgi:hypothetical protein